MKPEMLQVQQYLNVHPILGKNEGLRKKYVVLLNFFRNPSFFPKIG